MIVLSPEKAGLYVGTVDNAPQEPLFSVTQNYPNPATGQTAVNIMTRKPGNAVLEVSNLAGQRLITIEKTDLSAGNHRFIINTGQLSPGIYFYTVRFNNEIITNKMVVL